MGPGRRFPNDGCRRLGWMQCGLSLFFMGHQWCQTFLCKKKSVQVHLVGGVSGLVATLYLKPRRNRFAKNGIRTVSDPTKAILGFLMIWWGWLAFNTSSNYAVTHGQWTEGMRSAVGTILASAGGGKNF